MTRSAVLAAILTGTMYAVSAPAVAVNNWTANGATACEKFLTPDVVAAILRSPAGAAQRIDASSCHAGPIYISLNNSNIDVFRQEVPRIVGAHTMAGVGDGAFWNQAGAVSAVKGHDRGCDISVIDPGAPKIHGEALGQKLGAVCNRLFGLP
ncbi:MAG TPA: hypothetical protein VIE43_02870 [Thermoanaerobaculia bacterium]|nr:hypothetical protein [Thermoanaerobaculia bacterium]